MIIFFDGVSGVGKTTFLDYVARNYNVPVMSIKQNRTWRHREKAKQLKAQGLKSFEARLFYFDLWLQLCNEIIATGKDKLIFIDRSPVSLRLYNGDDSGILEKTIKELLGHDIKTVLCTADADYVRKNKKLKAKEKNIDHNGLDCGKMIKVWEKCRPFGKEWDAVAYMKGHKDTPKRLLNKIIDKLGVELT